MSRTRVSLLTLSIVLALSAGAAWAQPATGAIQGTITGDTGNKLEGVTVTVQNQVTGARFTATTNAAGRYAITNLSLEGEYHVSVALARDRGERNVTLVPGAILVVAS
jgi:hypothetical protein